MSEGLSKKHAQVLDRIFAHPLDRNLQWREVVALFENVGTISEEHNGHYKVTVNDQQQLFRRPRHKDVADVEELQVIRHFLERAGVTAKGPHHKGEPGDS